MPRPPRLALAARLTALLALLLGAGCTHQKPFVYRPVRGPAAAPQVPFRLAVLPFEDATEDYLQKGTTLDPPHLWWNLARGGAPQLFEPVTAPLWAQGLARQLEASGRFRSARFCVDLSEVVDEDYLVTGMLTRADLAGASANESRYEFRLAATRRKDGRKVWERTVSRAVKGRQRYEACGGFALDCVARMAHEELQAAVAGMYEEAGADLAQTLAGTPSPAPGGPPAAEGPVDETIRRILDSK